jgi:hypothetical protein
MHNPQLHRYQAAGKTIICSHCGNDSFDLVGVAGISFAGHGIKCSKCTHIEYFGTEPSPIREPHLTPPSVSSAQ